MSIQEHLNKIRNAIYGREVRESIAKGIEAAYDDASEKDNANMEVKIARGTHPNLRSRLEEVDNKQQQTTAQLAQTDSRISEIITTPVDGTITQQEIIDARQGHTSLGDNFQTVKDNVTSIDKRTVIPMINHIKNGNFADGTAQWTGLDRSSISVVNNILTNKALGGYAVGWALQSDIPIPYTIGRKVFIKARVRVTNAEATEMAVFLTNGDGNYAISTNKIKNPIMNKWYTIHEIISVNSGVPTDLSELRFEHKYPNTTIATGKEMEVQYVMAVDLTADFKVTPSVTDILGILSKYPNEWFDKVGTQKTVDDIYDIILKQNDVYFDNEIQNGGFTNGTIGWMSSDLEFGIQAENGELVATANVDGTPYDTVISTSKTTPGDEYYVSYEINPFRTHSARFLLGGVTVNAGSDLPAGEFSKVSGIITTIDNTALHMYANGGVSTGVVEGAQTIFRKPIVINMSKKFGTGNEPTKEYMDNLIERLGWFDNRKILSNSDLMFLIEEQIKTIDRGGVSLEVIKSLIKEEVSNVVPIGSLDDVLTYENEPWEEM